MPVLRRSVEAAVHGPTNAGAAGLSAKCHTRRSCCSHVAEKISAQID
jgi:hypothetical protein